MWSETAEGEVVQAPCTSVSSEFVAGPSVRRRCLGRKQWSPVDFTSCTLEGSADSFAITWMTLNNTAFNETLLLTTVSEYLLRHSQHAYKFNLLFVFTSSYMNVRRVSLLRRQKYIYIYFVSCCMSIDAGIPELPTSAKHWSGY